MADHRSEILALTIRKKQEAAFWELDDIVVATAPDTPKGIMDAWIKLHDLMTPEFIADRDRVRGPK